MNTKIDLFGWAKFDGSDEKLFINLIMDPEDGATLTVHMPNSKRLKHSHKTPYAHCEMNDGSFWCCLELLQLSIQVSMPGHTVIKYHATWAIKNIVCSSIDDILIYNVSVGISALAEWLSIYGFYDFELDTENDAASVKYKQPKDVLLLDIPDVVRAYAFFSFTAPFDIRDQFPLTQHQGLCFEFLNAPKYLKEAVNFVNSFLDFFDVILGAHPIKESLVVTIKDDTKGHFVSCEVFYMQRRSKRIISDNTVRLSLVKYKKVNLNIVSILNAWVMLVQKIEPVVNIIVEFNLKGSNLATNTFLNLAQALETFHRRMRNNELEPREAFKERVEAILNVIPQAEKALVRARLMGANEPGLARRIDELLDEIPEHILKKVITDRNRFKKVIRDNRNYFTHFDKYYEEKNKVLEINKLSILNYKIHFLFRLLLLKEVGISFELLESEVNRNKYSLVALQEEFLQEF